MGNYSINPKQYILDMEGEEQTSNDANNDDKELSSNSSETGSESNEPTPPSSQRRYSTASASSEDTVRQSTVLPKKSVNTGEINIDNEINEMNMICKEIQDNIAKCGVVFLDNDKDSCFAGIDGREENNAIDFHCDGSRSSKIAFLLNN